jgi:hypothetical protein
MEALPKTPQGTRATDRVLDALSTLAELLDRSINEVKALDSDFHNRLLQAVHDTESSIQDQAAQHLQTALTETRAKLEDQFTAKMAELSAGWDAERARLNTEWETERKRLNGEIERLAQMQAATQAQAEKAMAAAKAAAATTAKPGSAPAVSEALTKEIDRVEGLIHQIAALMDDASTDLATVIRKNVEKAELESYLKGIRFALNGGSAK